MIFELGLHKDDSEFQAYHLSPIDLEVRQVVFWGCFTYDRYVRVPACSNSLLNRVAEDGHSISDVHMQSTLTTSRFLALLATSTLQTHGR